jgi:hypothetical protein
MRRRLILCLAVLAIAAPAFAAEHGKKDGEEDKANGLYVDIAQVGLPVIIKGRLVNYVFAAVRLVLAPGANVVALRTKEPYFRDALVRAAHRTPFTVAGNPNKLDEAALKRVLTVEAARIAGPRAIAAVQVTSQTPQKLVNMPAS